MCHPTHNNFNVFIHCLYKKNLWPYKLYTSGLSSIKHVVILDRCKLNK